MGINDPMGDMDNQGRDPFAEQDEDTLDQRTVNAAGNRSRQQRSGGKFGDEQYGDQPYSEQMDPSDEDIDRLQE